MIPLEWTAISVVQMVLVFLVVLVCSVMSKSLIKNKGKFPPGPISLPIVGYLPFLGKAPAKTLAKVAETYGDIFSLYLGSKYTIIFNELEAMKEALSNPAALNRAPNLFDHIPGGIGFGEFNGPKWEEQRRFCLQAMKKLGFGKEHWEDLVKERVQNFVDELEILGGRSTDISDKLKTSISENMASLVFGRHLNKGQENDKIKLLADCSEGMFKFTSPVNPAVAFPTLMKVLQYFDILGYGYTRSLLWKMSHFVRQEIKKHEELEDDGEEKKNFLQLYLEKMKALQTPGTDIGHYFSRDAFVGNTQVLLLGGSDTVFSSLIWTFHLMALHTDIQRKVHEELDMIFGRDGVIIFEKRSCVPYTLATLMEVERFVSVVPLITTRRTNADISVRGFRIPKGTALIGNMWAIHHDPRYWERPEEFRPERFLSSDGKMIINVPSYSPFSVGARKCPGEAVAWMEMFLYFASVMQKFQVIRSIKGDRNIEATGGLVVGVKNPEKLCFVNRD